MLERRFERPFPLAWVVAVPATVAIVSAIAAPRVGAVGSSEPSYRMYFPDWPIAVVGDGHTGAAQSRDYYYSWNGKTLRFASGDRNHSERGDDWAWNVRAVNAAGTVVGEETVSYPASTSGIAGGTNSRALIMSGTPSPTGLSAPVSNNLSSAAAIDDAGDVAGDGTSIAAGGAARPLASFFPLGAIDAGIAAGAIDAKGDVAGTTTVARAFGRSLLVPAPVHVFVSSPAVDGTKMLARDLGAPPACANVAVVGIDDAGEIAGNCTGGAAHDRAWLWDGHVYRSLPPLPGDATSSATGMTGAGLVAGSSSSKARARAAVWSRGRVRTLASLTEPVGGVTLTGVTSVSHDGWVLATATRARSKDEVTVILAPPEFDADAKALARKPLVPTPTPEPTEDPSATPAPEPTADSSTPAPTPPSIYSPSPFTATDVTATSPPAVRPRWSQQVTAFTSDATHAYTSIADTVRSLDEAGHPAWTRRAMRGVANLRLAGSSLLASGTGPVAALDPASGALRWRHAAGDVLASDTAEVQVADEHTLRRYALPSGALLGSTRLPAGYAPLPLTSTAFGQIADDTIEPTSLAGYGFATGRKAWSLPGVPPTLHPIAHQMDAAYFGISHLLLVVHPAARTFDTIVLPLDGPERAATSFDGAFAYTSDGRYVLRYRTDRDLASQSLLRVAYDGPVAVAHDRVVSVSPSGLVSAEFGAGGSIRTTRYSALKGDVYTTLALSGSHAFVASSSDVNVVDLVAKRIVAHAKVECSGGLFAGAVVGRTAVFACGDPTSNQPVSVVGAALH